MDLAELSPVNMGVAHLGSRLVLPVRRGNNLAAGAPAMSGFSECEGDNTDAIADGGVEGNLHADHDAVIQDQTERGDAGSAQSTGKVDKEGGFVMRANLSTESWNDMRAVPANPLSSKSLPCSKNKLYRTKCTQTVSRKKMEQCFVVDFKSNPWSDV